MKLKPYPEYKDSGVEWIGNIPSNWDLVRNKNIFSKSKKIVGDKWEDYPVLSLTKKGVIIRDIESNEGKMPSDFSIYQIVRPNNLLLCLFDIDVTPRCVGYINNKGIVSAAYSEIAPKTDINTKYYYYWYLMLDFDKQLLHLSKNLRNSLSNEDFMALPIVKPTIDEQKRISSFLDKKTSEIDLTVEKYRRLIELLREKRTALINHVVTKGLDPTAEMKDSGVEWIGEIPEEWEVYRMRHLLKNGIEGIKIGPFGSMIKSEEIVDQGYKVYGQENVINMDFKRGNRYLKETKFKQLINYQLFSEDLVITMMGTTGKAQIVPDNIQEGIMDSHLIRLRFNQKVIPKFMEILINSSAYVSGEITYFGKGAIMHGLNSGIIKNLILAIPPSYIQEKILNYLDIETSKTNLTIQKIQNNIELLEEYKKSLIHHVVTGKVDVRGVVV